MLPIFDQPGRGIPEPPCEQRDIEAKLRTAAIVRFLEVGEQIEQERAEAVFTEHLSDILITRTRSAASASMGENDHACRACGQIERTIKHALAGGDLHIAAAIVRATRTIHCLTKPELRKRIEGRIQTPALTRNRARSLAHGT